MSYRYALKAALVGFLMLVLLVPLAMINGTIKERANYRQEAVTKIAESFAGPQLLAGPVLVLPYVETRREAALDAFGKPFERSKRESGRWIFFPQTMALDGELLPSTRNLGLHEVRVYELRSQLQARFDLQVPADPNGVRELGTPYLSFSIADVRGLVGSPALSVDGAPLAHSQGNGGHRAGRGLHAMLAPTQPGKRLQLSLRFDSKLGGTESLQVAPLADSNRITLRSPWPHPQFSGRFLPHAREIGASGFRATWDVSSLASAAQAQYRQGSEDATMETLQLGLVDPVNVYTQADRASKYGVLFVLLTFVGFFMFELLKQLPIHPIQYGLVGLALAIFFLLLLSLSEHFAFWIAYLLAAGACIGLLGTYLSAVLRSRARGWGFAGALTLLYGALYGLLVSEDNALVLGSLMLFAILAAIMLATRRIDWYAPLDGASPLEAASPPPLPAAADRN
jgi:inner membrane protein